MKFRKYMPMNLYTLDNIVNNRFIFSKPEKFNDPFDCYLVNEFKKCNKVLREIYETEKDIKILSLFRMEGQKNLDYISRHFWSFYGNSHKGVCVEIDIPDNYFKNKSDEMEGIYYNVSETLGSFDMKKNNPFCGKVEYIPNILGSINDYLDMEITNDFDLVKKVIFIKDDVFIDEEEFRFVKISEADKEFDEFNISNFQRKFIFGMKCENYYETLIFKAMNSYDNTSFFKTNENMEEMEYEPRNK